MTAATLFNTIDHFRTGIEAALEKHLAMQSANFMGAPESGAAAASAFGGFAFFRVPEEGLLAIVSSLWIFYPLLLCAILALLYVLGRTVSRRRFA